jgi:hypothetical protein
MRLYLLFLAVSFCAFGLAIPSSSAPDEGHLLHQWNSSTTSSPDHERLLGPFSSMLTIPSDLEEDEEDIAYDSTDTQKKLAKVARARKADLKVFAKCIRPFLSASFHSSV